MPSGKALECPPIKGRSGGEPWSQPPGARIQGLGQVLYKARVRNASALRGEIEGYRIILYLRTATDVLLVAIYSKSERSDTAADDLLQIVQDERRAASGTVRRKTGGV
jgi:hypothetical protein